MGKIKTPLFVMRFVMRFAILLIESFFTFQNGFVYIYIRECGIFEAWTSLLNSGKKINTKTRNNEWYVVSGWGEGKERKREKKKQKNTIARRGKREMINNSMDSMDKLGKLEQKWRWILIKIDGFFFFFFFKDFKVGPGSPSLRVRRYNDWRARAFRGNAWSPFVKKKRRKGGKHISGVQQRFTEYTSRADVN